MVDPFDSSNFPLTEPESIILGSHYGWVRQGIDVDDTLFDVKYDFYSHDGQNTETVTGSYDSSVGWVFEISGAASALWIGSKSYRWDMSIVRKSDNAQKLIASGHMYFYANTEDRRTHAELMVAKINSLLEGRADSDVESYTIKSRSLTKMGIAELTKWRDYYLDEIRRTGGSADDFKSKSKKNTILARFV
jgi:hypothetical protein